MSSRDFVSHLAGVCRRSRFVCTLNSAKFFLDPASLESQVSPVTYQRGLTLYRNQQVLEYQLQSASSREWTIEGEVQDSDNEGNEPYWVSVLTESNSAGKITYFDGDCSCDVGNNCKHTVAIVLKAAYKSGELKGVLPTEDDDASDDDTFDPEPLSPQEQALQAAHGKVGQWLDQFDNIEGLGASKADASTTVNTAEQYVYLLKRQRLNQQEVLVLGFATSHILRKGSWAKAKIGRASCRERVSSPV